MSPALSKPRLAAGWLVGVILVQAAWIIWFLLEPLPSAGEIGLRRFVLVMRALPAVVPGVRWGDSYLGMACGNLGHFENLPQRLPIALTSLFIAGAAVAVGSLVLRGLGVRAISPFERVALGFGLGTTFLGLGTLILGRSVGLDPFVTQVILAGWIVAGVGLEAFIRWRRPRRSELDRESGPRWSVGQIFGFVALVGPFSVMMGLGAMLPTIEFDALEYHLGGPKEYFLDGRISFLPHNVYASMPFGVEMLHLLGMLVAGDWWLGGLAGQELVAWFAAASAILIAGSAARIGGSSRAGWFSAVIYLTTPWIFRFAGSPFVEGPLCFFHAALIWAVVRFGWLRRSSETSNPPPVISGVLVGLLAGGAMAIKYPALISAVIPASLVALVEAWRIRSFKLVLGFAFGLGLVVTPWLAKNVLDTGNPVYPLAWSIFGGTEWDSAREAQWQAAHGPRPVRLDLFARSVLDVAGRSDWQSPLYAALVPLAWLGAKGRRTATPGLAVYVLYLFATWWFLTHRLDRFWLPMLPALAILAGLGSDAFGATSRLASGWLTLILVAAIGSNLTLCSTELSGPTAWTGDLDRVRDETALAGTPGLARLDLALPFNARPLVIGQAGVYGLRHRPVFNTVFNRDILESLARDKPPEMVRRALLDREITHIYVDWSEIDRYRKPGNYGFSDFETPELFEGLVEAKVLDPAVRLGAKQVLHLVRMTSP